MKDRLYVRCPRCQTLTRYRYAYTVDEGDVSRRVYHCERCSAKQIVYAAKLRVDKSGDTL